MNKAAIADQFIDVVEVEIDINFEVACEILKVANSLLVQFDINWL